METKEIRINEIDIDTSLFLRDGYDEDAVERYAILFESGTQKPILVSEIADRNYKLIDGFHRLKAAQKLKYERIQANVEKIDPDEWLGRAIQENNDATRGIFLTPTERNTQIGKLIDVGKTQDYMAQKFGISQQRITQIINGDEKLKKQATSKINITSVNEWLTGKTHQEVANILKQILGDKAVERPRVTQIINNFEKDIKTQYSSGLPISAIVEQAKEGKYNLTEDKCKEILTDNKAGWLGWNQIVLGDCLEKLKDIPEGSVDMVLTDPPYGIEYQSEFRKGGSDPIENDDKQAFTLLDNTLKLTNEKLKENANIFIFSSWKTYPKFQEIISKYFRIKTVLVWVKNETGLGDLNSWMESHEFIIHAIKGKKKLNLPEGHGRPSNVFISDGRKYAKTAGKGHPVAKPIDLCKELIEFGSEKNDCVLDPFCGSGATLLGAIESNRRWYGIEIDEKYHSTALERIKEVLHDNS